jgi:hypothetical protein
VSRISETLNPGPYGNLPGHKEFSTSKDAARAMSSRASVLRERVHAEITAAGRSGLTADQVAARLGETVLAVRPRLSELYHVEPPRIVPTGERRTNDSGLRAKVWRAA